MGLYFLRGRKKERKQTSFDVAVGADGAHGDGRNGGDDAGQEDDDDSLHCGADVAIDGESSVKQRLHRAVLSETKHNNSKVLERVLSFSVTWRSSVNFEGEGFDLFSLCVCASFEVQWLETLVQSTGDALRA